VSCVANLRIQELLMTSPVRGLAFSACLAVCFLVQPPAGAADAPGGDLEPARQPRNTRSFRLGFTNFPHDFTVEAVLDARKFIDGHADIIAHHIEGVPWAECLNGLPLPEKLLEEWNGKRDAAPEGGRVYLAISPGRGDLKVTDKGLPLPSELEGKPYDDPLVEKIFLEYCRRALDFFRPDYLSIGIEVNEIWQAGKDKWTAYAALHRFMYREVKKTHPDLPVFASFTLHGMLNQHGEKRDRMLEAYCEILPCCDLIGVSFYPFIAGGTTDIAGAFDWMTRSFDRHEKPYAVVETGEAADKLTFPSTGQVIHGTPQKQAAYYEQLLALAEERRFEFVISFLYRDYDALWEKIRAQAPEVFMAWRDCGLLDEAGRERPAYRIWKRWHDRPLRARAKTESGR
jgi:hypothetical protein